MKPWTEAPLLVVSWGEVFDKLTILQLKQERFTDECKRANVIRELTEIENVTGDLERFPQALIVLVNELRMINARLWDVENHKRDCESRQCFDSEFIMLAREVYFGNDKRAAVKREINELLGSTLHEEKSYESN